jgi:ABC-type dipeptide/oligopeptide/nickel transport system permease component
MTRFLCRRVVAIVIQALAVTAIFFVLLRVMPADPAASFAGGAGGTEGVEHVRRALHLNQPVLTQLWHYLTGAVHLNLGHSWGSEDSVLSDIVQRAPLTITVVGLAFLVALLVAIPLGRAAAARPEGVVARVAKGYSLLAGSQPEFFWGLILVFFFSLKLKWFPVPTGILSSGYATPKSVTDFVVIDALIDGDFGAFGNILYHLVLPVCTLAFVLTGPILKMTRESILTVVNADYIVYARATGQPERAIRKTMLANAIGPIMTLTGILFAFSLGGSVLVEFVFSLNGIGLYALNATLQLDYPAVEGTVLVLTLLSLLLFLAIDLVQASLDPRVRLENR